MTFSTIIKGNGGGFVLYISHSFAQGSIIHRLWGRLNTIVSVKQSGTGQESSIFARYRAFREIQNKTTNAHDFIA